MPVLRETHAVAHSAQEMFDLVADVERYPEFVPLCDDLQILRRTATGDGTETLVARMRVGYKAISETFTSRVELDRAKLEIRVEYVDGPFRHLVNRWSFREAKSGKGSEVDFFIDYEFRSIALRLLMGQLFDKAFRRFVSAFEARADAVYGASA